MNLNKNIFITGGTGYIGSGIIPALLASGFRVTALTRESSHNKLHCGAISVTGNALNAVSYSDQVKGNDTFIHLVGVAHPGPGKSDAFRSIDLVSIQEAVRAASENSVKHFVYMSVAHPAPVMKNYIEVRMKGEELIRKSGMNSSILRPWYVLGPGHRWPLLALPVYAVMKTIPSTSATARRLYPVKLKRFIECFVHAVCNPPDGIVVYGVEDMLRR